MAAQTVAHTPKYVHTCEQSHKDRCVADYLVETL